MNKIIRVVLSIVGALLIAGTVYMIPSSTSRMFLFVISILGFLVMMVGLTYPLGLDVGDGGEEAA